jgi:hypothetical protein
MPPFGLELTGSLSFRPSTGGIAAARQHRRKLPEELRTQRKYDDAESPENDLRSVELHTKTLKLDGTFRLPKEYDKREGGMVAPMSPIVPGKCSLTRSFQKSNPT